MPVQVPAPKIPRGGELMGDPLTNGWVQLAIAFGSLLGLICFFVALKSGMLRFPKPNAV
jgi:hypothetical protein